MGEGVGRLGDENTPDARFTWAVELEWTGGDAERTLSDDLSPGDLRGALEGDGDLCGALEEDGDLRGALEGGGNLSGALEEDGDLRGALEGDGDLSGTLEEDGDLSGTDGEDGDTADRVVVGNRREGECPGEEGGDKEVLLLLARLVGDFG